MHEILDVLPEIWAELRAKSLNTVSAEKAKPDDSKEKVKLLAKSKSNRDHVKLLKSLWDIKIQGVNGEKLKKIKKPLKLKLKMLKNMLEDTNKNYINIEDTEFKDCILATALNILVDIEIMCNELHEARVLCAMNLEYMVENEKQQNPKFIIPLLISWHQFYNIHAIIEPDTCYIHLISAMKAYDNYTDRENYPTPVEYDYLYRNDEPETDPLHFLDSLHIYTLKNLMILYNSNSCNLNEFVNYMSILLQRISQVALLQSKYNEWCICSANLAFYYIRKKHFSHARGCLLIASQILVELNNNFLYMNKEKQDKDSECEVDTKYSQYQHTLHSINLIWVHYGIELIRASREQLVQSKCETTITNNSSSEPDKPVELPIYQGNFGTTVYCDETKTQMDFTSFRDKYLVNYDDVKNLYQSCWEMIYQAVKFFKLHKNFHRLGEAILYFSRVCKYFLEFDPEQLMQIEWETLRIDNLESIVKELNESTDLYVKHILKIVLLELGLAHCAVLDSIEESMVRTGEDLSTEAIKELLDPAKRAVQCFQLVRTLI